MRQNDFGGTFGGPVFLPKLYDGRNRTFFFFSYEGLRLRSPQPARSFDVPGNELRQQAPVELAPYLNAFPVPIAAGSGNGLAPYTASWSNPGALDSSSIRIDHMFSERHRLFGRYSDPPSDNLGRSLSNPALVTGTTLRSRAVTLGLSSTFNPRWNNDFRFNFTHSSSRQNAQLDNFGGAQPFAAYGGSSTNWLLFYLSYGLYPNTRVNPSANAQRQYNIVNTLNWAAGRHAIKLGVDYRRLGNHGSLPAVYMYGSFLNQQQVLSNSPAFVLAYRYAGDMRPVYENFSAFVQDEWRLSSRLSLSLGLRWDVNPAPQDAAGNQPLNLDRIDNLAAARLSPQGTSLWATRYANFAPRIGLAYRLRAAAGWDTVLRAGGGLFYDTGNAQGSQGYWAGVGVASSQYFYGSPFPLTSDELNSIPPASDVPPYNGTIAAFDPKLRLPVTGQWNVSFEQGLGTHQTLTVGYVGSAGRRLLTQKYFYPVDLGNPYFGDSSVVYLTRNGSRSDYHALQAQFQRKMAHGLQVFASYAWAHALDDVSTNFTTYVQLRANSNYDIRHSLQTAFVYDLPVHPSNRIASALLSQWSLDGRISARSALPVDVRSGGGVDALGNNIDLHPDRVPGQPLYVDDANVPGGRRINFSAFVASPGGGEGDAGRNVARAFSAVQADLAVRRQFSLGERCTLQFRAEGFNVLNHPVFGSVFSSLSDGESRFGIASGTLNNQLGGLNSLYQIGGSRSIQLALRLQF